MRDILVAAIVFGSLPLVLARPYIGILVWSWLGYMNPHRLSYGFAYDFPFAFCVAIATLLGTAFSREPKRIPVTALTVTWLAFIGWMLFTTFNAMYPATAWVECERVMKIQLMTFATIVLMNTKERLRMLVWTIVISLGYYGMKGGLFTILTGGEYRVWGPPESYVEGNNEIALATLMLLPLMAYLRGTTRRGWLRLALLVGMILCAFAVVGSQSRGAFVGGAAMAFFLWIKSRHKVVTGAALAIVIAAVLAFMPQQWYDRMRTIETYQTDASAMGRVYTWEMSVRVANDKPLGGGFAMWTADTFDRYSPEKREPHDAHSIYFKVLGEHGWIGLALFLGIWILAWRTGSWTVRVAELQPETAELGHLARMTQVSLAAFGAGGAFLSLSYFDLFWHMIAILVLCKVIVQQHVAQAAADVGHGSPITVGFAGTASGRSDRSRTEPA